MLPKCINNRVSAGASTTRIQRWRCMLTVERITSFQRVERGLAQRKLSGCTRNLASRCACAMSVMKCMSTWMPLDPAFNLHQGSSQQCLAAARLRAPFHA